MDPDRQLYEAEATGWQRGLYEDVRRTLRAPIVNWIFRTLTANRPELMRYLWGQVKPVFGTRAAAELSVAYRDTVLSGAEAAGIEAYRPADVDVSPAEYRELRGQVATFDVVAPRLALLFELLDRAMAGRPVAERPDERRVATAPFPARLDRDRGLTPTLLDADGVPPSLDDTVAEIREVHFGSGLASIHRCLAQWPAFFRPAWADVRSVVGADEYERAVEEAEALVGEHVATLPYRPRIAPDDLRGAGFTEGTVEGFRSFLASFTESAFGVVPTLHPYAALAGASGPRRL